MSKRNWLILAILAGAILAAYFSGLTELVSFDAIKAQRGEFLAAVEARPLISAIVFLLAYGTVVALSLPAASIMTLLGGFLFGPVIGTLIVVVAATAGATVVFLIARTSIGKGLRRKAGPLYERVANGMRVNAFEYLLFIRIVPLFPFFLVNILPALFDVRIRTFVAATFIGIIPGTFVYANLGRELGTITGLEDLMSLQLLFAFLLLGLVALIPVAFRKWKARRSTTSSAAVIAMVTLLASSIQSDSPKHVLAEDDLDRSISDRSACGYRAQAHIASTGAIVAVTV